MILGYTIDVPDNDHYMFEHIILSPCAKFSNICDLNIIDTNFKFKKKYNISSTYEDFTIVSERFRQFCEDEKYMGLEFIPFRGTPGFYWFKTNNSVEYDFEARRTRFINYNSDCKGYEQIIGATPAYLKSKIPLQDNFFRTDICFGSNAAKSPLYLVGEITMRKLKEAGFKEIHFEKILDIYPHKNN